jgi:hypothetical protein
MPGLNKNENNVAIWIYADHTNVSLLSDSLDVAVAVILFAEFSPELYLYLYLLTPQLRLRTTCEHHN